MSEQRISQIPGRKDKHPITITHGTEPNIKPATASMGQVNVTVKDDMSKEGQAAETAAYLARASHVPSQIITNPVADPALEVCLGENLVLRPNPVCNTPEGWRTKGGASSHEVYKDGEPLSSSEAVKAVYDYLVSLQDESK